jgi:competence CoiA-like predicted nuclease
MVEDILYPEEVRQNTIIRTMVQYRFFCPECGRRLRLDGIRKYTQKSKRFAFQKCKCGYKPAPEVLE